MNTTKLNEVARKIVAPGRGILAADESTGSIEKRFQEVGITSTEETRRSYRELLFGAQGIEEYLSGVILFDETIRQSSKDGKTFPKLLSEKGIVPGIKVDKKTFPLALFPGEVITDGLDGLRERFTEYATCGAEFAKWRAVITIGADIPTTECIDANAHALARYAAIAQEMDVVPIIEPEVLMDGNHTIEKCFEVTDKTLKSVFAELKKYRVAFSGMILKPNMVLSGKECSEQADISKVAELTVKVLSENVPPEVPGIVFLSGGQSPQEATDTLQAINALGRAPWELSFSYGRALQREALEAWRGKGENINTAREAFLARAKKVSLARQGKYIKES